jgi:hypothetical protein
MIRPAARQVVQISPPALIPHEFRQRTASRFIFTLFPLYYPHFKIVRRDFHDISIMRP